MRAAAVIAFSVLASAAGCHLLSGVEDFTFPGIGVSNGGSGGLGGGGGSPPCEEPVAGMVVTSDVFLCSGSFELLAPAGKPAIDVGAHGVTVECDGTVIDGTDPNLGSAEMPTIGIRVGAFEGVTVRGCSARGYRYGLVADGSTDITLEDVHFDDNYTDPSADWLFDDVPGGGIALVNVVGGLVTVSTFARNWNGIELRGTTGVTVTSNVADHATNAGALLLGSTDNELSNNDFSWALRGGLSYPSSWYGVDTKDSAGIILDGGSDDNVIVDNDASYGGDGIFIRGLADGGCCEGNFVSGNTVSFSPHNGIESWCDDNVIENNIAGDCHYGIWTGGSDRLVLRGNTVSNSRVDGMSLQIGENRHVLIEDNTITGSARVGILLSGREYQSGQPLTHWAPNLANSSHVLVQHNTFAANGLWDLFVTSARLIVATSNCTASPNSFEFGQEVEATRVIGNCDDAEGKSPPSAVLADVAGAQLGQMITLDASASQPSRPGDSLTYTWLVQPSGPRFPSGAIPPSLLSGTPGATPSLTVDQPGAYDVDLIVDDGTLAAMAFDQLTVPPTGTRVGEDAGDWGHYCEDADCVTTITSEPDGADGDQIHVVTSSGFDFAVIAPSSKDLALDATAMTTLGFFLRARNDNINGWQGAFPRVVLGSAAGTITYEPSANLVEREADEWTYIAVPLAGGQGWTRTDAGASLDQIDWIEIHLDTWDYGYDLWLDAVTFY